MNPTEEQIWNYIDDLQSPEEREATARLIETDPVYRQCYAELLQVHRAIAATELEEPSLRFTANVMDRVAVEPRPIALKTKVNKWIIRSIAAFFLLSIGFIAVQALQSVSFSGQGLGQLNLEPVIKEVHWEGLTRYFLFADLVLGMLLIDHLLRRRKHTA